MKIPLTQGYFAEVDDEDYEKVNQHSWYASIEEHTVYARSEQGGSMHRLILSLKKGDKREADHRDGNGLNNRRYNLRICSRQQNCYNKRPQQGGTSRFKGVSWSRKVNKWQAYIGFNNKGIYLGYYSDQQVAAIRYDMAAIYFFGQFARINYPDMLDDYLEQLEECGLVIK